MGSSLSLKPAQRSLLPRSVTPFVVAGLSSYDWGPTEEVLRLDGERNGMVWNRMQSNRDAQQIPNRTYESMIARTTVAMKNAPATAMRTWIVSWSVQPEDESDDDVTIVGTPKEVEAATDAVAVLLSMVTRLYRPA
jgi:hypothetical protein